VRFQVLTAASINTAVFGWQRGAVWWKFTDVSEMLAATIIRAMNKPSEAEV
jgi:hypothetical protein